MAGGAGGVNRQQFGEEQPTQTPTSLFGNPSTFTAAANTQASDYDKIMAQYADLANRSINNPLTTTPVSAPQISAPTPIAPTPVAPQTAQYNQSSDVTGSLSNLSNLATTGGYSDEDIANIRERDISPIRSIYANAQQNAERQRALAGGYSPNFNAVQAQMARDEANKIGDVTTSANAGIAQNVATNKLSAAPAYSSASATANAAQTQADQANAAIINEINQLNAQNQTQVGEFNTSIQDAIAKANAQNSLQAGHLPGKNGQLLSRQVQNHFCQ